MIIYIYRESGQILSSKREKIADSFRQLMFIVGEVSESFETMERLSLSNDFLRLSFPWERVKKETIPTILFVEYRNDVSFIFLFFFIGKRCRMNHNNNVVGYFFKQHLASTCLSRILKGEGTKSYFRFIARIIY